MALNFPPNPVDGQLYPDPAVEGAQQYIWNADKGVWDTVFRGVERIEATRPLFTSGSVNVPIVNITPASDTTDGYMSSADKRKLNSLGPTAGTVREITAGVGMGAPGRDGKITTTGVLNLMPPTNVEIGGVRAGSGVDITASGIISLKIPTSTQIGGVKAGKGIAIGPDGSASIAPGGTYKVIDDISSQFDGLRTTFELLSNNVSYAPSSPYSMLVFFGGQLQTPGAVFTTSSSYIVFNAPPQAGTQFYAISLT